MRTVYHTVHSGYERLARYGGKRATQREAELCALSTYRCHLFPPNSLAEIASYTRVEHWNLRLYIHACQPRAWLTPAHPSVNELNGLAEIIYMRPDCGPAFALAHCVRNARTYGLIASVHDSDHYAVGRIFVGLSWELATSCIASLHVLLEGCWCMLRKYLLCKILVAMNLPLSTVERHCGIWLKTAPPQVIQ